MLSPVGGFTSPRAVIIPIRGKLLAGPLLVRASRWNCAPTG
jgi:hypothetical protein